jgi:hypothetical protein
LRIEGGEWLVHEQGFRFQDESPRRGVAAACKADKATVTNAVEAYYAQVGAKPGDVATAGTGAGAAQLIPDFLHSWPKGDGKYTIAYTSSTNTVTAAAVGGADIGDCATA